MFYTELFQSLASTSIPNYSITVIESEYFPTADVDKIKLMIRDIASNSNILIIYTESIPVTSRWNRIKQRGYTWRRLPGSRSADEIDHAVQATLAEIEEEFTYAVYYPSRTNLDNAHNVIRLLNENEGNILFVGRSSLIVDYCMITRQTDDYIFTNRSKTKEYISLYNIKDNISLKWPSPETFVLMTHLVRDDFGPKVSDLSMHDLISEGTARILIDKNRLLPAEDFARNLTMAMMEVMKGGKDILSGMGSIGGIYTSLNEFESSILALAINEWDPSFIQTEKNNRVSSEVVFLYIKLQYVGLYFLNQDLDYSWTVNILIKDLLLENVKLVYDIAIVKGGGFPNITKTLETKRENINYTPIPINLYRTAIMQSITPFKESNFWSKLYSHDTSADISHYKSADISHYKSIDAHVMPRDVLIQIAKVNLPPTTLEESVQHESIYSSMTPKIKVHTRTTKMKSIYKTSIPGTKFDSMQRRSTRR